VPEKWTGDLIGEMHNNGVTYKELAEELGVTKAYIGMILNGRRTPPGSQLRMEAALWNILEKRKTEGGNRCTP
jgi:transcriptional regulator with XRE-family HTH domain